jgi:drug/metabolite transporter (DMT)-like permease
MPLDPALVGLLLLAALMHASWNAIVKSDGDRLVSFGLVVLAGGIMAAAVAPFVPFPNAAAWPYLIGSTAMHLGYFTCLMHAYRHGDLSHVYPIARGLGPLLVAIASGRLAGEYLSVAEATGVGLVSFGVASLAFGHGLPRGAQWHPVLFAAATGVFIAGYTLIDGLGVRTSGNALGYIVWLHLIQGPWGIALAAWRRGPLLGPYLRAFWWRGSLGGVIATVGYAIAVWAMSVGGLAHVAALRETSVLFAAAMGPLLLGERFGRRRIVSAALVVAGLLLMNLPVFR